MTNSDIAKGKLKQAEGKTEDALGQATDSTEHQAKGKIKQAEGHIQEAYGKAKEAVKEVLTDKK